MIVALAGQQVSAQTLTDGSLKGSIRDSRGVPIGNVVLTLRDRATGARTNVPVNRSGVFAVTLVVPGDYDLTAEAFGLRPLRIEGIQVRAGVSTHVDVPLTRSENPEMPAEVRPYAGGASVGTQRISASDLERYPQAGRDLGSAARFSTISNSDLETEGLPGRLSGVRIDGMAIGSPAGGGRAVPALPLSAIRQAEFLNTSADVEWSGTAAPSLSVQSVASGPRLEFRSFGDWVNGPARTDGLSSPMFKGMQAGALVSGPFVRDTAGFVLGMELWRLETPIAFGARADSTAARAAGVARDVYGVDVAGYTLDRVVELNAVSAFGRLDWRFGEVHALRVSGTFTTLPETRAVPATLDRVGAQSNVRGLDGNLAATLTSSFRDGFSQEFRIGWDRTLRDYGIVAGSGFEETSTSFVQDVFAFGRDPALSGKFTTSTFRLRETVHVRGLEHHIKMGFTADLATHDYTYSANGTDAFWFSSTEDFARGIGYGVATNGLPSASFKLPRYGGFLQDEWSVGSRFRLLIGARLDLDEPPADDVKHNAEWFRLTGVRADSVLSRKVRFSPRLEFEWRPEERWALRGSGGVWDAPLDPNLVGEVLANDGRITVQRGFATFNDWPQADVGTSRPTLTLPAVAFQGPVSTRAGLQISRGLASGVELVLGGIYRRTEMLPRRSDLNRSIDPGAHDQYGRAVYGTLQQRGSLLAAASGSNRRFTEFDVVSALDVDGWSEYRGLEASLNARLLSGLQVQARYTYSKTEDNWFMAREGGGVAALSPLGETGSVDWTEGRSDFDVPQRALLGAELALPALRGVRLAALYRYRSGYPFTPGFHAGVDANGDGSLNNDPAAVDAQSAGFTELAARWPCLAEQAGTFAQRNSCRAESASFLDARVAVGLFGSNGRKAELVFDALNLVATGGAEVDRALYLVDTQRLLSVNSASGQVSVPLIINPQFGAPLMRASASRTLRIGLRVSY